MYGYGNDMKKKAPKKTMKKKTTKKVAKKAPKNFKPHTMYKGSMKKFAFSYEEHLKLKKKGYTHTKPKKK